MLAIPPRINKFNVYYQTYPSDQHRLYVFVENRPAVVSFWWLRGRPTDEQIQRVLHLIEDEPDSIQTLMSRRTCTYIFLDGIPPSYAIAPRINFRTGDYKYAGR